MSKLASLSFIMHPIAPRVMLAVWNKTYHCWGFPGGKVEPGETLEAGHERELFEETGLTCIDARAIYSMPTYSGSGRICHVFEVLRYLGKPSIPEIGSGIAWMTYTFMENEPKTGPWFKAFFAFRAGHS